MTHDPGARAAQEAVASVWRIESARLIGALTRQLRDLTLAEDLAQDALVAALEQWPREGVPRNPGAWLMTIAKRRALDRFRHQAMADIHHAELGRGLDAAQEPNMPEALALADDGVNDDVLRLMFIACHPMLAAEACLALTLKLVAGLSTPEIARAFLVPETTVAQRIVRAQRTLSEARVPFELPPPAERAARLASVLGVLYLLFNEGYTATAGEDWLRPELCNEALRLGRILAGLSGEEPEVLGLLALMELQASRQAARVTADGTPILLPQQNRARWDPLLIRRGLAALARAEVRAAARDESPGPYALQAAIAACHARARQATDTDWPRIAQLYEQLARIAPSPVIELNRAVALGMAFGPAAGLRHLETLMNEPALARYHLLPSVRGDFLEKLGRRVEAAAAFRQAAGLTRNAREQGLLQARAAACEQA